MIEKAWKRYCEFQLELEKDEEYQLLRGRFLNQQILFQGVLRELDQDQLETIVEYLGICAEMNERETEVAIFLK